MKKFFLKFGWVLALSLPIAIFLHSFAFNTHGILFGDWDYFAQAYEAARRSILEFNQFPWFNPWVAGGVPLYANPQFGLFSLPMALVLLFGTLPGLHLTVLFYFLLGFWGMYLLLKRLSADKIIAVFLSYIWVFSGFPVWRLAGGHLTFATYLLAPLFIYLLLNIRKKRGWIWFGLFTAALLNQNLHYMMVHLLLIGFAIFCYQIYTQYKRGRSFSETVKPYLFSAAVIIPLVIHKIYYSLQFIHDYSRTTGVEAQTPFNALVAALTFRGSNFNPGNIISGGYGWAEYAAYFGLLTLGLFAYLVIRSLEKPRALKTKAYLILAGIIFVLLLAVGNFSSISPYSLLKKLPVFSEMQVAARWLGWVVFGIILFLARLPRKVVIISILAISLLDVFQSNISVINQDYGRYSPPQSKAANFEQFAYPKNTKEFSLTSQRLLYATQSNKGDIFGYEPVFGFGHLENNGYQALTNRCAINKLSTCSFILSHNARLVYWSPNKIQIQRIAPGDIRINANPGSYWEVNGQHPFKHLDVLELKENFIIKDASQTIVLEINP